VIANTGIIPNTTYDQSNGIRHMIDQNDGISIAGSEKIRMNANYQKYNLKDYKNN
jgi:hypothetical protein